MPKRKFDGAHRRVRSRAARQVRRNPRLASETPETRLLDAVFPEGWRLSETGGQGPSPDFNPYAPQFGETVVLAASMRCASCPTDIEPGAEATYIDGEPNCTECTWEARHG